MSGSRFVFGPFRLETAQRALWRANEVLRAPPQAIELLVILIENRDRVLLRDELLQWVWSGTSVEEHSLTQTVFLLRKVLGDNARRPLFIEGIAKRGYRFIAPVRIMGDDPPATPNDLPIVSVSPFRLLWGSRLPEPMLPLWLTEATVQSLSRRESVRTRVAVSPSGAAPPDFLIDATLQASSGTIGVEMQLIETRTQTIAHSELIKCEFNCAAEFLDEASSRIANAVVGGIERQSNSVSFDAQDLYRRGRLAWNHRTGRAVDSAMHYFRLILERRPRYTPALVGMADCFNVQSIYSSMDPGVSFPQAKAAAQRALSLDHRLPEAHASLGYSSLMYDRDWEQANGRFRAALDLNPSYATAHQWLAEYQLATGQLDEAIASIQRAASLDPASPGIAHNIGFMLYMSREYDDSIDALSEAISLDHSLWLAHVFLGRALAEKGMQAGAIDALKRGVSLSGLDPHALAELGRGYAVFGMARERDAVLHSLDAITGPAPNTASYGRALICAASGDRRGAMGFLQRAYASRCTWLNYMKVDPALDELRADSEFQQLQRNLGF